MIAVIDERVEGFIMLTSRQQNILTQLMEEQDFLPIDIFINTYGLSPRTVRNDLLILEEWLKDYGVILERDRKLGFRITLDAMQKENLAVSLRQRPEYLDSKMRVHLLRKRMLTETKIQTNELLDEFKISRNTLLLDLAEVKEWLSKRNLNYSRESGWIQIKGNELCKRNAYLELLRTEITDEKVLQFILDRGEAPLANQLWNSWFRTEDAHFLFDAVKILEKKLSIEFSDASYSALILHLLMAIKRLKNEHTLRMDKTLLNELQNMPEFQALQEIIVSRIEEHFAVQIPMEEIGYMTQHVLGAQKKHMQTINDSLYVQLAKQIIIHVEQELGHSLQRTEKIVQGLAIHLKPAIYRARFGLQTKNPLLDQLEAEFSSLLVMIERIVKQVMEPYEIEFNRDEIGYIVMHIGSGMKQQTMSRKKRVTIVCSSGLGTSSILRQRMESLFPDIDIVGEYSYQDLKEMTIFDTDAVLTMIDIGFGLPIPWLKVSPLLPETDQERVSAFLGVTTSNPRFEAETIQTVNGIVKIMEQHAQITNRNKLLEDLLRFLQGHTRIPQGRELTTLLPVQSIQLQLPETDWETAIRSGNQLLRERGLTGLQYEEKLVQMIESQKHHFIIHEGIAFPHASVLDGVWETGFSLLTFRRPIPFGPSHQPVWLIITLAAVDKKQHVTALSTLLDALNDTEFMESLRETNSTEEVWNRLKQKEDI